MKQAKFEELKFGDRLAIVKDNGDYEHFTYLCRDPGYKEQYAFLMLKDGIHAVHFYKPEIERIFVYNNFDEVKDLARKNKARYCRDWLIRYDYGQLGRYEI